MARNNSGPKDIKEKIIKVLQRDVSQDGKWISELRVACFVINGKPSPLRLERRDKYVDASGEEKSGKCTGLTVADCDNVVKNWATIRPLMAGGAPAPQASRSVASVVPEDADNF